MSRAGVVAAGSGLAAGAGARVLADGGNAIDAALAAVITSCVSEPLLTGLGAGGYLLAVGFDDEPVLLDFFVAAPGLGGTRLGGEDLEETIVDFGDTTQAFHVGASSVGAWGMPAGLEAASRRWGSVPLADLCAPAARHARDGVRLTEIQGYLMRILDPILRSSTEAADVFVPGGRTLHEGERWAWGELGEALERLGAEGAAPFYTGELAERALAWLDARGGALTAQDLRDYAAVERSPLAVGYRGRTVLTNPPPNAGGVLLASALRALDAGPAGVVPDAVRLVEVMEAVQAGRTPAFTDGLVEPGFAERFLAGRHGATTHVSVLDRSGRAVSVTSTNGEGCGLVVPGTGLHPNNVMGEEDLNPAGFGRMPAGRRMPSMMAPTVVVREGRGDVELVLGSAGSNRIRSALLQTIVGVLDAGRGAPAAVGAPRLHVEGDRVFAEPGVDVGALRASGRDVVEFSARNLFFGGVQAVHRDPGSGAVRGAGDPRRGGAVA